MALFDRERAAIETHDVGNPENAAPLSSVRAGERKQYSARVRVADFG